MNLSKTALVLLALLALTVLLSVCAVADPGNDTPAEAQDVYDGSEFDATVQSAGGGQADDDWFRIYLTEGQFLKLGMIFDPRDGLAGIRVFGPEDHTRLVTWSTVNDINAQEIDMFVSTNGSYYIRVWVFDGNTAPYHMEVHALTPPVVVPDQAVSNNADPLRGRIISSTWFRIYLQGSNTSSDICEVSMTWTAETDTHLTVLDRKDQFTLNPLNYSWSRDKDKSESCRFAASYSGYYYIRAHTTTAYTDPAFATVISLKPTLLTSKHPSDGNAVKADAKLLEVRQTVRGKIVQAFDTHDWYKFYLNEGEQFSAKATVTNSKLTIHWDYYNITLYTSNGTVLTGAYNTGSTGAPISVCSIFLGRAPYTGIYFMSFSGYWSYSGSGTTDYTSGKLVNTCKYEIDVLIPNRRVWIVDPPGEYRMKEDDEITRDLTKVFWDPEGDELSYGVIGGKQNFTIILTQSTGLLTIRPNANWYGTEEIQIWAHDGRPDQKNTTKVLITVTSVPDPPVVINPIVSVKIYEDEVNTTALNLNDIFDDVDIEDRFLLFSSDQNEFIEVDIDQTSGRVTLQAVENYNGQQKLTFFAADTVNYRVSHQITIIVLPTNDAPEAVSKIPRFSMKEGENSHIDVKTYFKDIDGDDLYYYAEWDQEDAISFDNAESNPLNSWFDIYPEDPNFYGFVQVIFICYDRDPLDPLMTPEEARQSAILEVENVNDPPRIDAWTPDLDPTIFELEQVTFRVPQDLIYDVDSNTFRWKWYVNDVEQVEVSGESFTFPREPGYNDAGTYVIRCELKDSLGEPANLVPEWVLTIKNTNRAPTVNLISTDATLEEGTEVRLRADGYDQDDDSLLFEWYQVDDAGREHKIGLGRDFTLDKPLPPGSYRFKCVVSDGEASVGSDFIQIDVKAHEFPPTVPGFGGLLAALAIAGALALATLNGRRP